jgi:hypothetical protein
MTCTAARRDRAIHATMTGAITKIRNCTGTMNDIAPAFKASPRENTSSPRPLPRPRQMPVRLAKALEVSAGGATRTEEKRAEASFLCERRRRRRIPSAMREPSAMDGA